MRITICIAILLFFGCINSETKQLPVPTTDVFKVSIPNDTGVNYFPEDLYFGSGKNRISTDSFVRRWYSNMLYNFREPVLYNYTGKGEAIRLLLLPSFGNSIVIRLNRMNDTVYANIKELTMESYENEIPKVKADTVIMIESRRWQEVLSKLEEHKFWSAGVADTSSPTAKDGTSWLLECRIKDKYHCIERWDSGDLISGEVNLYAKDLIDIGKTIVSMEDKK